MPKKSNRNIAADLDENLKSVSDEHHDEIDEEDVENVNDIEIEIDNVDVEDVDEDGGEDDDDKQSSSKDKSAANVEVSKEFENHVVQYVKYDDLIRTKEKELRDLKSLRKPHEAYILGTLDKIDENIIEITGGKLRRNKSETKERLSKDIIEDAIKKKVKDPKDVAEVLKMMEELRPVKVNVNLKRTGVHAAHKIKTKK